MADYWRAASGAAAPGRPSAAAAVSAADLAGETEAAGTALPEDQGFDSGAVRMVGVGVAAGAVGAAASGEASAAVAPVAVGASWGPETGTRREGRGARMSVLPRFLRPPGGSAEGAGGSISERLPGAAGRATPAAGRSHWAAAASA